MVAQQLQSLQSLNLPASSLGAWIDLLTGWILVEKGEVADGLAQMRRGMATAVVVGGSLGRAIQCLFLAQGCARAGQVAAGLAATEEALAWIESTNVRLLEAEVHRTRGELLRDQPGAMNKAAEACFRRAIDLARQQGARWWELRATVSLSRLLSAQASTPEEYAHARQMLADIYGWFREGLGTRDLQEARELLTELA
jgi:adenylate cyclase